jgi:hypothetical protein
MTNLCPDGFTGVRTAQANQPAAPTIPIRMSQTSFFTVGTV